LYVGLQRYFLTFCTAERCKHFADHDVAAAVRDQILSIARVCEVAILVKQRTGYAFSQRIGRALWQSSFHDRILRNADATLSVARYIFENPVRAGLAASPAEYPLLGSERYSVGEVLDAIRWQP